MKSMSKFIAVFTSALLVLNLLLISLLPLKAQAADPTGAYFQLRVSPSTGVDNTGDGGTGNPADFNYYFVGQTFNAAIRESTNSQNTISANVIIHYDPEFLEVQDALPGVSGVQIQPGTIYQSYPYTGNTVNPTTGTIKLTGFNTSGYFNSGSGEGTFGTITFNVIKQKTAHQDDLTNPTQVTIQFDGPGITTDSNINNQAANDIMSSKEDSSWNLWPDETKPYTDTYNTPNGTLNVPVTQNYVFHFKDDETGVVSSTLRVYVRKESGAYADYTAYAGFSCSGIWGTNDCVVTVNPPGVRNWDYNRTYFVRINSGQDRASPSQTPPGPNTMDEVNYWFKTEPDIWAPYASNHSPARFAGGVPTNTNVSFDIVDLQAGVPGTGVNLATLRVLVKGEEFCQSGCPSGFISATPISMDGITYGYRITVNPAGDFAENELVPVSIYGARDYDDATPPLPTPNQMASDNYTFTTRDTQGPIFSDHNPGRGDWFTSAGTDISFHVKDTGQGVNIDSVSVRIGDNTFTRTSPGFSYSGDSSDYLITVDPGDFASNKAVPIWLKANDLAGNSNEDLYAIFFMDNPTLTEVSPTPQPTPTPRTVYIEVPSEGTPVPTVQPSIAAVATTPIAVRTGGEISGFIEIPPGEPTITSPFSKLSINSRNVAITVRGNESRPEIQDLTIWRKLTISGQTTPNAVVVIEVQSNPVAFQTLSDSSGNWSQTINVSAVGAGKHKVFARVVKGAEKSDKIHILNATFIDIPYLEIIIGLLVIAALVGTGLLIGRKNRMQKVTHHE